MSDQGLTRDELLAEVVALRARVAELERGAEEVARPTDEAQSLTLEQEFCRVLLEHLPNGVVACDANGNLLLFNQASRDWHGMDARTLPPSEWASHYDLFRADGVTPLATEEIPLVRAFRGERVRDVVFAIVAKGQAPRFVCGAGAPILDADGEQIGAVAIMHDVTAQRQAEEAQRASEAELREALRQTIRHEELIRAQSLALAELSTPLIPIREDVVVMPLIGALDSQRVQQVMTTLLSGISERRARVAILNVTGVSVVDAQVVNGLLAVARAAALLGSQVVLTGITPKVAQTLVSIDAALDRLVTRGTLQSGIAYAMHVVGDREVGQARSSM